MRDYDWRPLVPIVVLLALSAVFLPWSGSPSLWSLEPHQQIISLSSLPTTVGSLYWFQRANEIGNTETPEERILDE